MAVQTQYHAKQIFLSLFRMSEVFFIPSSSLPEKWLCPSVPTASIGRDMFHPWTFSRWADREAPSKATIKVTERLIRHFFGSLP